ncbi:MAG: hypothetical protein U5L98_06680 [Halomonas sp.]|uniref:hypothetical protein n=1 Tax=Halomonas sp. TaxID=1486246 RepID=UPI002ACECE99|nr:hypothetical protein [Halomonas sp.]MDZ7852328.1 hypothetical protein [Halomonas sp.]
MKGETILTALGAGTIEEAVEETRYAIEKQANSIGTVLDTNYGYLRLTDDESAEVQSLVRRLLERRLAVLEGGQPHV